VAFPTFEITHSSKPIAIIKTGDRQLDFIRISKVYSKYFIVKKGGFFELDDEYEYKYNKTGIYIYNFSNSKPLSLAGMEEIDEKLKSVGDSELVNKPKLMDYLERTKSAPVDLRTIQNGLIESFASVTNRFIQDYSNDDEFAKTNILVDVHNKKRAVTGYSSSLIGIGMGGHGVAVIQVAHKQIDIVEMTLHENFAYTKYGTFFIERDSIYQYKKQPVCFFILNDSDSIMAKPLTKQHQIAMKKMIKSKQWYSLTAFNRSDRLMIVGTSRQVQNISLSSEKALAQFNADSPSIFATTVREIWESKEAVATKLSDNFKKAIPIVLIFACLAGFALLVSNAATIIDTIAKYTGAKPIMVVVTEDEARRQGLLQELNPDMNITNNVVEPLKPEVPSDKPVMEPVEQSVEPVMPPIFIKPITLIVPENMTLQADNPNGKIVEFSVSGLDQNFFELSPTCDHISGTIFPVGTTTVTCNLKHEEQEVFKSFSITILGQGTVSIIPQLDPDVILPPLP